MKTKFYDKVEHKIELMEQAQKSAVEPEELPRAILKAIGRCALFDIGSMAVATRLGTWFLPFNAFTGLFATAAPFLPDYIKVRRKRRIEVHITLMTSTFNFLPITNYHGARSIQKTENI